MHIWMLASLAFVYGLSFINPFDRLTWALETTPGLIGIIILIATYSRFRFSDSTYAMIWFGAVLLILGGFYAFGNVPFFSYLQDKFSLNAITTTVSAIFSKVLSPLPLPVNILKSRRS